MPEAAEGASGARSLLDRLDRQRGVVQGAETGARDHHEPRVPAEGRQRLGQVEQVPVPAERNEHATGTLDEQLATTAEYLGRELDYKLKKFTALFEPAVILVMGGLVAFVAIALVSAMYGIFHQVHIGG